MQLSLTSFSLYDTDSTTETTKIGAELNVKFQNTEGEISGSVGLTFLHEGAENLTFKEVEKIAIEKVLAAL